MERGAAGKQHVSGIIQMVERRSHSSLGVGLGSRSSSWICKHACVASDSKYVGICLCGDCHRDVWWVVLRWPVWLWCRIREVDWRGYRK
jgi:hypothetical protein